MVVCHKGLLERSRICKGTAADFLASRVFSDFLALLRRLLRPGSDDWPLSDAWYPKRM